MAETPLGSLRIGGLDVEFLRNSSGVLQGYNVRVTASTGGLNCGDDLRDFRRLRDVLGNIRLTGIFEDTEADTLRLQYGLP